MDEIYFRKPGPLLSNPTRLRPIIAIGDKLKAIHYQGENPFLLSSSLTHLTISIIILELW